MRTSLMLANDISMQFALGRHLYFNQIATLSSDRHVNREVCFNAVVSTQFPVATTFVAHGFNSVVI